MKEKGIIKRHKNVPEKAAVSLWYFQSCLQTGEAVSQTSLSLLTGISRGQVNYYLHPNLIGEVSFNMASKSYVKAKCESKLVRCCKTYVKVCNRIFNTLGQMRRAGICSSSSDLRTLHLYAANEMGGASLQKHKEMFSLQGRRQVFSVGMGRVRKHGDKIAAIIGVDNGKECGIREDVLRAIMKDVEYIMAAAAETHRIMNSLFVK